MNPRIEFEGRDDSHYGNYYVFGIFFNKLSCIKYQKKCIRGSIDLLKKKTGEINVSINPIYMIEKRNSITNNKKMNKTKLNLNCV